MRKSERGRHKHTIFLFFFCCLGCGFSFRFHIYFTIYISYCKTFVDQLNYDDITWTYGIGDFSNTTTNFNSIRVIGNYFERGLFWTCRKNRQNRPTKFSRVANSRRKMRMRITRWKTAENTRKLSIYFYFFSYIKVCLLSCEYLLKISTVSIGCTRIIERVARQMRQGEFKERNTDVRTRWYNARNSSKNG